MTLEFSPALAMEFIIALRGILSNTTEYLNFYLKFRPQKTKIGILNL